jgi:hypothetical protein
MVEKPADRRSGLPSLRSFCLNDSGPFTIMRARSHDRFDIGPVAAQIPA